MSIDYTHVNQIGVDVLGTKHYYGGCTRTGGATAPGTNSSVDTLYASPLVSDRAGTIDEIAFYLFTTVGSAGAKARLGLYTNSTNKDPYPASLIIDFGENAIDSGANSLHSITISPALSLDALTLYWMVLLCGGVTNPAIAQTSQPQAIYGADSSAQGWGIGIQKAFSYAPLPNPFPTAGIVIDPNSIRKLPSILIHYVT